MMTRHSTFLFAFPLSLVLAFALAGHAQELTDVGIVSVAESPLGASPSLVVPSAASIISASTEHATCSSAHDPTADCDDCEKQAALATSVAGAYKGLFYDNNFNYLCDSCYYDRHLGESFKRLCLDDFMTLDIGGQYRFRYHEERNMRGLGLTGRDDSFGLQRTRVYANLEIFHRFRVYAEMLDAVSFDEDFPPRPIQSGDGSGRFC